MTSKFFKGPTRPRGAWELFCLEMERLRAEQSDIFKSAEKMRAALERCQPRQALTHQIKPNPKEIC